MPVGRLNLSLNHVRHPRFSPLLPAPALDLGTSRAVLVMATSRPFDTLTASAPFSESRSHIGLAPARMLAVFMEREDPNNPKVTWSYVVRRSRDVAPRHRVHVPGDGGHRACAQAQGRC